MALQEPRSPGTPALGTALSSRPRAGRLIRRRTRSRIRPISDRVFSLLLSIAPFLDRARAALIGAGSGAPRVRLDALPRLEPVPGGEDAASPLVRLRGRVEVSGTVGFETPGGTEPAVFARSIYLSRSAFRRRLSTYTDETRGLDFVIRLPSGESVQLAARDVRLHDSPRRVSRPNLAELGRRGGRWQGTRLLGLPPFVREMAIRIGDTVEAAGMLVREVGARGEGPLGRGTPLLHRLVPPPGSLHLWLRRIGNE